MRKLWNRRPSPAMVVACVALLVALGGTSVAAVSQLARNSVGPAQLQFGAVTNPKIRSNAVTSAKVRNRSLLRADFASGAAPGGADRSAGACGSSRRRSRWACRRHRRDHGSHERGQRRRRRDRRHLQHGSRRAPVRGQRAGDLRRHLLGRRRRRPQARHAGARAALQRAEPAERVPRCRRQRHR